MKRNPILCVLVFLLSSGAAADDKARRNDRDPWYGFPKGSWIVVSETQSKDGESTTKIEKQTQTGDAAKIELKVREEGKTKGTFDGKESTRWHVLGADPAKAHDGKLVETKNQELTIEGKKFACTVKKYELKSADRDAVVTIWHCKDVSIPYRELGVQLASVAMDPDVLRIEIAYKSGKDTENVWAQVVSFKAERAIGNRKIICVKEEGGVESTNDGKKGNGTLTRWLSNEIPGREVAIVAEGKFDGKKFSKTDEVLEFGVPKTK